MPGHLLLMAAVLLPLAGGMAVWLFRRKTQYIGSITIATTATVLLLVLTAWFAGGRGVTVALPNFLFVGLSFRLDILSLFFAVLFSGTGTVISVYSVGHMTIEQSLARFYFFLLLTFTGCMGVVLAADLFTLFLFFELMTFSSYVLVIHKENDEAMNAGFLYLFFGVIGGLALLLGIIFLYSLTGSAALIPLSAQHLESTGLVITIAICFLVGFGIKAGIVPLHIWMPKAYAVAPTPANAISSGIMIKTGAYGLFMVFYMVLFPLGRELLTSQIFGWLFLWVGLLTMLIGAFLALQQRHVIRTLAYSSISQIGYVVLGLGAAMLPMGKDLYGVTGMLFHILNHTVFKVTLFMAVGAIYVYTRTLEYSKLGGLLRRFPVATVAFVVSALGITGMPGFNGYASKTFLHHALTDLYSYNPTWLLWLAEKIFVLASALTICYFVKMFVNVFLGQRDWGSLPAKMSNWFNVPLLVGAFAVIVIGLLPGPVVSRIFAPALLVAGLGADAAAYASGVSVWIWPDLWAMVVTAAVAAVIYFLVRRFSLDKIRFPSWLSVERLLYLPIARGFLLLCLGPGVFLDRKINQIYHGTGDFSLDLCRFMGKVDRSIDRLYGQAGSFSSQICRAAGILDKGLDQAYNKVGSTSMKAVINLGELDNELDSVYSKLGLSSARAVHKLSAMEDHFSGKKPAGTGKPRPDGFFEQLQKMLDNPKWNISNLNVEAILVALALVVVVIIFVFYGRR